MTTRTACERVWCVGRDALVCVHNSAAMSSNVNVNWPALTNRRFGNKSSRDGDLSDGRTVVRAPVHVWPIMSASPSLATGGEREGEAREGRRRSPVSRPLRRLHRPPLGKGANLGPSHGRAPDALERPLDRGARVPQ